MNELELRPCRDGEDELYLALHNRSFAAQWTRAWWDWRYRRLPRGEGLILGAWSDGRLIGMYAGVQLLFQIQGEAGWALSQGDVAVDAAHRGGTGRQKVVVRLGRSFLGTHGGGETKLTYGFPIPPLRRLASRFLGGQVFTDLVFLIQRVADRADRQSPLVTRRVASFAGDVDALWERVRGELGAALVRDRAYLHWRYTLHPLDYTLIEARGPGDGGLRGVCVLREGGWHPGTASLMEWLVPAADVEAETALIEAARAFARERGRDALVAWFSSGGAHFYRFQVVHGFFARATPYQEEVTCWHPGADREWLLDHWYQTMGDIDFF